MENLHNAGANRATGLSDRIIAQAKETGYILNTDMLEGASCKLNIIQILDTVGRSKIIGAVINVDGVEVFIERQVSVDEGTVRDHVRRILTDDTWQIDKYQRVRNEQGVLVLLGAAVVPTEGGYGVAFLDIANRVIQPKLNTLVDEGSLEKSNWRFKMLDFAQLVFKHEKPDGIIALMPGSSDAEYSMWMSMLGFDFSRMIFIESDTDKLDQIHNKLGLQAHGLRWVNRRFGNDDGRDNFAEMLSKQTDGRDVSVLSFDTESKLTTNLYHDLVEIIRVSNFTQNAMVSLNIVTRTSASWLESFMNDLRNNDKRYESVGDSMNDVLSVIISAAISDAGRNDLEVKKVHTDTYIGGSSTSMSYMFAHIIQK